ncbi:MAG: acyl-CoA reductase, partial [Gillisia sp.]
MTLEERKIHFSALGKFLEDVIKMAKNQEVPQDRNEELSSELLQEIDRAVHHNGWFTRENVLFSIQEWSKALSEENLHNWLQWYDFKDTAVKTIGIVMAGNIPLVGFHDFLSALMAGHHVVIKQSSNDKKLLPILAKFLIAQNPEYAEKIKFTEGKLENFDAVIATGSNNTSRYFEYYFAEKPSIIRKNRNSVAVLTGRETPEELEKLGEDIFRYFGLGC